MEAIEKKFRDTPLNHKKYVKRLSEYITVLLEQGRILESQFYFLELERLKPNHERTGTLGYELAIKTFNNEGVLKFDTLLAQQKLNEQKLLCLRLKYYYSVHNANAFDQIAEYMFENLQLKPESLKVMFPMVLQQKRYRSIVALCLYLKKNKKVLNASAESSVRKVILQRLVDVTSEAIK